MIKKNTLMCTRCRVFRASFSSDKIYQIILGEGLVYEGSCHIGHLWNLDGSLVVACLARPPKRWSSAATFIAADLTYTTLVTTRFCPSFPTNSVFTISGLCVGSFGCSLGIKVFLCHKDPVLCQTPHTGSLMESDLRFK